MDATWQENVDTFYFRHGKCCAGCDWWRSVSPLIGECSKAKIVGGIERWDVVGLDRCSLRLPSGHPMTKRDYVCGQFKDDFDWASLPLSYRIRIGQTGAVRA